MAVTMPPPENGETPSARRTDGATPHESDNQTDTPIITGTSDTPQIPDAAVSSQQVCWSEVHDHVAPLLASVPSWPMAGTPAWCALDDQDPAKTAALLDAAQHWALRVETCQEAMCETSRDVSAAADWRATANALRICTDAYIPRKVATS
jgi:hypothetical protein